MCDLYYINRDTLFSYNPASENFLRKMMSLFVSSHYKNSPNDLQLMSDAPAHSLFVLMGPLDDKKMDEIPDILCALQVCAEGNISKDSVMNNMKKGIRPSGDLIPWTVSEQFQDNDFALLSGIRIVRIATHPHAQKMGYGSKAIELLTKYYEGELLDVDNLISDENKEMHKKDMRKEEMKIDNLSEEVIKPKKGLKPLMQKLSVRKPLDVHYVGTSYGITQNLFNFWKKNEFESVYIRYIIV